MKLFGKSIKWWFYSVQGKYFPESDKERWAMHVVKQNIEKVLKAAKEN